MPLVSRQSVLLAAIEGEAGTPEDLDATDGEFNIFNVDFKPDIPMDERPGQGGFGSLQSTAGARMGKLSFETDLAGDGVSGLPKWATTFLPGCGMAQNGGVYSFATTNPTLTIASYVDGIVQAICGSVGTFTIPLIAGKANRVKFEFVGKLVDDADDALPDPTFPSVVPPRWAGNEVTIGAYTPILSQLTLTAGNETYMRPDATDSLATGYLTGWIVDRKPTVDLDPEAVTIATKDWLTLLKDSTEQALHVVIGADAGNMVTIAAALAQVIEQPLGDRNKIKTRQLKLQLNGNSPFTIAFN